MLSKLRDGLRFSIGIIKKHPLLSSVIINGIFTTIVLITCDIRYDTNDDLVMAGIVQGAYGQPDPHTVYINILLGYVLSGMSRLIPTIPWYPVTMYLCLIVSNIVIGYLLIGKTKAGLFQLNLFFIYLFVFGSNLLIKPQFTKTAAVLTISGIVLMLDSVQTNRVCKKKCAAGIALISLGFIYRKDMASLCAAVSATYFLYFITKEKFEKKRLLSIIGVSVLAICICGLTLFIGDYIYKSDSEWATYEKFQNDRSKLCDYYWLDYDTYKEVCDANGISKENLDYYASTNDFADPDIFTVEVAANLANSKENPMSLKDFPLRRFLKEIFPGGMLKYYDWCWVLTVISIGIVLINKRNLKWTIINFVGITAVEAWLSYNLRFLIERLDISIFITVVVGSFAIASDYGTVTEQDSEGKRNRVHSFIILLLIALCLGLGIYYSVYCILNNHENAKSRFQTFSEAQAICDYIEEDKGHLYIRSVLCDNPWECAYDIWDNSSNRLMSNVASLGGWMTYSPIMEEINEHYGVANPYKDLVNNDKVYLINIDGNPFATIDYINRNYQPEAKLDLVKEIGKAQIYRVITD